MMDETVGVTSLVEDDGGLDGALVPDALEGLAPLLQLEGLVHNALGLDLAAVEVVHRGGEHVRLGEGADDRDFWRRSASVSRGLSWPWACLLRALTIAEDLGRRP